MMRIVAIIAVIAIHSVPFKDPSSPLGAALDLATIINQMARFAVPLFFVLSGYFWVQKIRSGVPINQVSAQMSKRLLILFVGWSLIYLLPTDLFAAFDDGPLGPAKWIYWNVMRVGTRPFITMFEGTKQHLWFLMSLLTSVVIAAVLLRYRCERTLIVLAILLYLVGLAGNAYSDAPLGFYSAFNFRDGPFFSLIFFVSGTVMQRFKPEPRRLWYGLGLAGIGLMLQFVELQVLHAHWGTLMAQDYVLQPGFLV